VRIKRALPKGYQLENYTIQRILGGGGFSIVYLAMDNNHKDKKVVIKEYMPINQATRTKNDSVQCVSEDNLRNFKIGFKRFIEEAGALAKLEHPNIVQVNNFFRANNTVYMVMNYEKGKDLRYYIKQHNGKLTEKFIRTVFPELLHGLNELHFNNLLHLDIKPANIFLRPGGKPLLLDFGAAREAAIDNRPNGPHTLTKGFAPIEQHQHKSVGPWSDFYALGASMYACMSGRAPPPSTSRIKKDTLKPAACASFERSYSPRLLEAVDWCLELHHADRPQSANDLLKLFEEDVDIDQSQPWYMTPIKLPWGDKTS